MTTKNVTNRVSSGGGEVVVIEEDDDGVVVVVLVAAAGVVEVESLAVVEAAGELVLAVVVFDSKHQGPLFVVS